MAEEAAPVTREELAARMRRLGISDTIIQQVLSSGADTTGLGKAFDQVAYLRKGALDSGSKTPFGAVAQGLMGYAAEQKEQAYRSDLRKAQDERDNALKSYFRDMIKALREGRTSPEEVGATDGQGGVFGDDYGMGYEEMFKRNPEFTGFGGGGGEGGGGFTGSSEYFADVL